MKSHKELVIALALLLTSYSFAAAQQYEYGTADELKGLKTYFIDTNGDATAHEKMVDEVRKALPDLKLLEDADTADVVLAYEGKIETTESERLPIGYGRVFVPAHGSDRSKPRVLMSFTSRKDNMVEKQPYIKFAREFIKAYKKANGLK